MNGIILCADISKSYLGQDNSYRIKTATPAPFMLNKRMDKERH